MDQQPSERTALAIQAAIADDARMLDDTDALASIIQRNMGGGQACIKCGHKGADENGWCLQGRPYTTNQPDSNKHSICPCRCVFPPEPNTAAAERQRIRQGVEGLASWSVDVKHHTLTRLDSFVDSITGRRLTYKELIAE